MFHYGKAYSIMDYFTGSLVPYLLESYWLLGRNLPNLFAFFSSGEAELAVDDKLTSKSHPIKSLRQSNSFPDRLEAVLPKQDPWDLHGPVRSFSLSKPCLKLTATRVGHLDLAHDLSRLHEEREIE